MQKFLELQCLVDDSVNILELSVFIKLLYLLTHYLMKWMVDSAMKKDIFLDTIYIVSS